MNQTDFLRYYNDDITELPEGLIVEGGLNLRYSKITELPEGLIVEGGLDLSYTEITQLPEGLTVDGWLDLSHTNITKLPEDLTINSGLDLSYTEITQLPEGLTVDGWLDLKHTSITELPEGLIVEGNIDLRYSMITKLPEELTISGNLDLGHSNITELPEGLTVGEWLNLSHTNITELPEGLRVGRNLILSNNTLQSEMDKVISIENGEYVDKKWLYADGILTHIKKKKKLGSYTFYIGKIPGHNVVTDGTHFAHCSSLREGIADLKFKEASYRGADQYKDMSMDTIVTLEDAKTMYRIITGACRQGTEAFVNKLPEKKEMYSIRECIELTRGQYNAKKFEEFFLA